MCTVLVGVNEGGRRAPEGRGGGSSEDTSDWPARRGCSPVVTRVWTEARGVCHPPTPAGEAPLPAGAGTRVRLACQAWPRAREPPAPLPGKQPQVAAAQPAPGLARPEPAGRLPAVVWVWASCPRPRAKGHRVLGPEPRGGGPRARADLRPAGGVPPARQLVLQGLWGPCQPPITCESASRPLPPTSCAGHVFSGDTPGSPRGHAS